MYKLTHSNEQSQQKSTIVFSSTPLWQGVYAWSTDAKGTQQDLFWTLSVPCLGKQLCHCTGVKQLLQAVTQNQIQAKRISPSCCHGSSKYGNGVLLCRGPRLRECTTAWQSVWLCGRIKHASMPFALFTLSQTIKGRSAQWQTKRRWNCRKTEQVGWELKVLSVGLKWKKCRYFLGSPAVVSKHLPLLI